MPGFAQSPLAAGHRPETYPPWPRAGAFLCRLAAGVGRKPLHHLCRENDRFPDKMEGADGEQRRQQRHRHAEPTLQVSVRVLALPSRDLSFQLPLPCMPRLLERRVRVQRVVLRPSPPPDRVDKPAGHVPDRPDVEHEGVRAMRHRFEVGVRRASLPDAFLPHLIMRLLKELSNRRVSTQAEPHQNGAAPNFRMFVPN